MTPPKCILDDISNYIDEIDPTTKFINSKLLRTTDAKDKIMRGEIYELFKDWSLSNGNTTPFTKILFYKSIDKSLGESKKLNGNFYYTNVKVVNNYDDDDDDDNKNLDIQMTFTIYYKTKIIININSRFWGIV